MNSKHNIEKSPIIVLVLNQEQSYMLNAAISRYLTHIAHSSEPELQAVFPTLEGVQKNLIQQARSTALLHPLDIEAIQKLVELNALQMKADQMSKVSEEYTQ